MRHMRLTWIDHIEKMDNDNWVGKCRNVEVDGARGRGTPQLSRETCVISDYKNSLHKTETFGEEPSRNPRSTHASMGKGR